MKLSRLASTTVRNHTSPRPSTLAKRFETASKELRRSEAGHSHLRDVDCRHLSDEMRRAQPPAGHYCRHSDIGARGVGEQAFGRADLDERRRAPGTSLVMAGLGWPSTTRAL